MARKTYLFKATVDGQNVTFDENNPVKGKYKAIVILTMRLNTDAASLNMKTVKPSDSPASQKDNTAPLAGTQPTHTASVPVHPPSPQQDAIDERSSNLSGLSTSRDDLSSTLDPDLSASVKETLSPLYHDKAKREARRNSSSGSGDKYVDVNKDDYQRFMQSDQILLAFEERGTYLSSPFILVENGSQLYINFYQFNENKPVSPDSVKMLSQIFEIKGDFPNYVKICKPALMVPKNGGYVIQNKGELFLAGAE